MNASVIIKEEKHRKSALNYLLDIPLEPVHEVVIQPYEEKRNLDQNAKLWPMLNDVSTQVVWHGRKLTTNDWKDMFTAALRGYDVVPNIDGNGFVALGMSTSKMNKRVFSDLIELIYAFGSHNNVKWSEKSNKHYEEYGRE